MRVGTKFISSNHPILNFAHPTLESFIWNTLIRSHSHKISPLFIFNHMRFHRVSPDFHTFPFLISSPFHTLSSQSLQAQILHFGFTADPFVQTSLITMYSLSGEMGFARQVFDEIPQPDLPSWNSIINGYVKMGFVSIARKLFNEMPERNVVSWSCMLNGYVSCNECEQALGLFREMQENGVRPNEYTMSVVLSACGRLGELEKGKLVYDYIEKCGMVVNVVLGTSLIDMYAKCGCIDNAKLVFDKLGPKKDAMAWSAMISALAMHGREQECIDLFENMRSFGARPDDVTFLGVLCACVHCGLVDEGNKYFKRMSVEFGIVPSIQHYGCMVDLYGRAGLIKDAWDVVNSMPMEPDVLVWGALLSGARMVGDIETCELALNKLIELEPTNSGAHVLLSNVYAKLGDWKGVRRVRDLMEEKGIKKETGCSLVELDGCHT